MSTFTSHRSVTATVTPITAADRRRAGVPVEHMIRLQGRMAMAGIKSAIAARRPQAPRKPDGTEPPRAA